MPDTRELEYTFSVSDADDDGSREVTIERADGGVDETINVPAGAELEATLSVGVEYREGGTVAFVDEDLST